MKRYFLLFFFAIFIYACSSTKQNALLISQQGVFASGGTVTEVFAGKTSHVDHASTFFQIPAGKTKNPIVYLHGNGNSRVCWQTTPDGHEAWSDIFLRKGYPAFLVDQPRRGEAGNTACVSDKDGIISISNDKMSFATSRMGVVFPKCYTGSAFPQSEDALNQFFCQMTPDTGVFDEKLFGSVLGEVLTDAKAITGKKAIYITHSQGGLVGFQTSPENIVAMIAIEPSGIPSVGSKEYEKFLESKIPIAFYFGDYIDNGSNDCIGTGFWKNVRDKAIDFAEHYRADGGDATVVDLPKEGITGNSHYMFQELNNKEIADHIEKWLIKRGL